MKVNWDENAPLKLLKSMPAVLNKKNVEEIQRIIDVDKFRNSKLFDCDLCGIYAPFCVECNRSLYCPCAQAYVRMKQAEGMQIEIAIAEDELEEEKPVAVAAPVIVAEPVVIEEPVVVEETVEVEEPVVQKRLIRIAVARKKR